MLKVHHPGPNLGDGRLRDDEGLPVSAVETDRKVPRQLQVLALVVSDGHAVGVVDEDVRRHQDRIGHEAGPHGLLPAALLLELCHPAKLAHCRRALEQPRELCVLGHVTLDEDRADVRVEPRREQADGRVEGAAAQVVGVVLACEPVEVDDAEETVRLVLVHRPLPQRPEVVADMQVTGGLYAREDSCHRSMIRVRAGGPQHPRPLSIHGMGTGRR